MTTILHASDTTVLRSSTSSSLGPRASPGPATACRTTITFSGRAGSVSWRADSVIGSARCDGRCGARRVGCRVYRKLGDEARYLQDPPHSLGLAVMHDLEGLARVTCLPAGV